MTQQKQGLKPLNSPAGQRPSLGPTATTAATAEFGSFDELSKKVTGTAARLSSYSALGFVALVLSASTYT